MELIVGPAGTGKTTTLATAVAELEAQGRSVFGMALVIEHRHPRRPPGVVYDLSAGATVIVDEAGTAATPKLATLAQLADRHGWRIVLVGDPRQFSAVGRGGMFGHLVDTHTPTTPTSSSTTTTPPSTYSPKP